MDYITQMIQACSHLVVASKDVSRMADFFGRVFGVEPHFSNDMFAEFVLPSRFRVAFFRPVGSAAKYFSAEGERQQVSFGVTVKNVDEVYRKISEDFLGKDGVQVSGPPKDHPWGEKSFLLIDPESNRWEIVQSPAEDGLLVDIDEQRAE